jgi:hypothetical protein
MTQYSSAWKVSRHSSWSSFFDIPLTTYLCSVSLAVNPLIRLRHCSFLRDPKVDLLLQHVERERAGIDYLVVELANIKLSTELLLGPRSQLQYL